MTTLAPSWSERLNQLPAGGASTINRNIFTRGTVEILAYRANEKAQAGDANNRKSRLNEGH